MISEVAWSGLTAGRPQGQYTLISFGALPGLALARVQCMVTVERQRTLTPPAFSGSGGWV